MSRPLGAGDLQKVTEGKSFYLKSYLLRYTLNTVQIPFIRVKFNEF